MKNEKINYQFKILSALGIIFVICGHYGSNIFSIGNLFPYDTFHMPLFIFISGYFYKELNHSSISNVIKYTRKKLFHLMIPYWIWNCIYGAVALFLDHNTIWPFYISQEIAFSLDTLFIKPFQLGNGFIYNVAAWFVGALFLVEFSNCLCKYLFSYLKIDAEIFYGIIFFSTGYLAIKLSQSSWEHSWKIAITRTMYLLMWYEFGIIYHKYLEKRFSKMNLFMNQLILLIIASIIIMFLGENRSAVVYISRYPDSAIITIIRALIGILFWLNVSKALVPLLQNNTIVMYISNHTFSLMMHQAIVGLCINGILGLLHKYVNLFPGFDSSIFRRRIWYSYTINNLTEIHILYVILIMLIILYIIKLYEEKVIPLIKNNIAYTKYVSYWKR